jgi:hypothetical protein
MALAVVPWPPATSMHPTSSPAPAALPRQDRHWRSWVEPAGWLGVIGLAIYFLKVSWLKWPDPQIDFGTQLYAPWRLAEGDVLYRDVAQNYGPLSQSFNALLFAIFGPGLMVLVTANLVIFGLILFTLGRLLRRAWGPGAAILASALFVSVFGFSQYGGIGNSNYATPYAHESTHGFLVCLLLLGSLIRWLEEPGRRRSAVVGFLLGLTAVLKPEFMLAGGLLLGTVFLLRRQSGPSPGRAYLGSGVLGFILPTLFFVLWFALQLPFPEALRAATGAWSILLSSPGLAYNPLQAHFLGFDQPGPNFSVHLVWTAGALLLLTALAGAAWLSRRVTRAWVEYALAALVMALLAWLALTRIDWLESGRCLFGVVAVYVGLKVGAVLRTDPGADRISPADCARILFAVLALSLLARMILNGRISQFGFYQAALAALLIPAVLVGELPAWLKLGRGKVLLVGGTLALILPAMAVLALRSSLIMALKTEPVGNGRDRFYAFPPSLNHTGRLVFHVSKFLQQQSVPTVLVLPEGLMINYLARKASPVPPLFFYFHATAHGREALLVQQLEKRPPEWVVLVSRDLRGAGIARYGDESGGGKELLTWIAAHYDQFATAGEDPLNPDEQGLIVYRRK